MRANRSKDGGYSLVEALASLMILAMISGLLVSGLSSGRHLWEHPDSGADLNETVEGAHATLRHLLERTFAQPLIDSSSPSVIFTGAPDSMDFLAPAQDSRRPSEIQRYRLTLSADGNLVLSSISDLAADPDAAPRSVVLLRNVQSVGFDYFGAVAPDNLPQWRPIWKTEPRLPVLIRIRLGFMPGDSRWWPTLIVNPAASLDLRCGQPQPGQCGELL